MLTDAGSIPAASTNTPRPTVLGWPFFLRAPACSRGLLRIPADFLPRTPHLPRAAFRSLRAVFLSDLASRSRGEVNKDRQRHLSRSISYALTVQAVGWRHRPAKFNGQSAYPLVSARSRVSSAASADSDALSICARNMAPSSATAMARARSCRSRDSGSRRTILPVTSSL